MKIVGRTIVTEGSSVAKMKKNSWNWLNYFLVEDKNITIEIIHNDIHRKQKKSKTVTRASVTYGTIHGLIYVYTVSH